MGQMEEKNDLRNASWLKKIITLASEATQYPLRSDAPLARFMSPLAYFAPFSGLVKHYNKPSMEAAFAKSIPGGMFARSGFGLGELCVRAVKQNIATNKKIAKSNDFLSNLASIGINADTKEEGYRKFKLWLQQQHSTYQKNKSNMRFDEIIAHNWVPMDKSIKQEKTIFDRAQYTGYNSTDRMGFSPMQRDIFESPFYQSIAFNQKMTPENASKLEYLAKVSRAQKEIIDNPNDPRPFEYKQNNLTLDWLVDSERAWRVAKDYDALNNMDKIPSLIELFRNRPPIMEELIDDNGKPSGYWRPKTNSFNPEGSVNTFAVDPITEKYFYKNNATNQFQLTNKLGEDIPGQILNEEFAEKHNLKKALTKIWNNVSRDPVRISYFRPTKSQMQQLKDKGRYDNVFEMDEKTPYYLHVSANPATESSMLAYIDDPKNPLRLAINRGYRTTTSVLGNVFTGEDNDTLVNPYTGEQAIVPYRYTYDQLNANPLQSDTKLYKNNAVPTLERFITKLLYKMGLNEVLKVEGQIPTPIYGRDYNWNIPELQNQRAVLFAGRYLADDTPENKKNTIQAAIRAFVNNDMPISAGGEWKVEDSWVNIDNAVESFKGGLGQAGFDSYKRLMKFISEHFTDDELKDWIKWGVKERNDLAMGRKKMSDVYTDMWVKDVSNGVPLPDNRRFPDPVTFPEIKEKRKLGDERPRATIQTNVGPNKYQLNLIPNIWNRPINNYFQ